MPKTKELINSKQAVGMASDLPTSLNYTFPFYTSPIAVAYIFDHSRETPLSQVEGKRCSSIVTSHLILINEFIVMGE